MIEKEEIDFKDTNQVLHVLRNPYGWNDHIVRNARLIAADAIEQKDKELAALRGFAKDVMNYFHHKGYVNQRAIELGLRDVNGKQTTLLKGG